MEGGIWFRDQEISGEGGRRQAEKRIKIKC